MAHTEERRVEPGTTTIIERRSGGGAAALIAALLVVIAAVAVYFLVVQDKRESDAVTGAAEAVQSTAEKAGGAIDGATGEKK
ncbi:hypothetical protein [Sphingomonas sanxanigenens]|uniref:Uncharacterized protein n=1 Tax=Sphingomonas sanxanigenens DSM 19645 = NX02 TaxID=1123269 RepID=W0A7S8_9SPHN|nr:hypothetical protein [Sphingomonas sanxanigenens]AHE52517.1 hypothetical protein NX02_03815 [Sphingomonas sanxanigenens DSM 19645 = NX02]